MKSIIYALSLVILSGCGGDSVEHKSVFIIGDSISIGYTDYVSVILKGAATVKHNPKNARNTEWTLTHLDEWLNGDFNVITWNNGLWDCNHSFEDGKWYTTPARYRQNLHSIARRLKDTGAKVVFLTTTMIPEGVQERVPGCEVERNAIAVEVMAIEGIPIGDLYNVSKANSGKYENNDTKTNVHFTEAGSRILADFVALKILELEGE